METHLNKSFFTLSREALIYINGLEDPEAKKDFLINCFLTQCEEEIKKGEAEQENLLKFDLPESETITFKNGIFKTKNPETIKAMNAGYFHHLLYKPEGQVDREKFDRIYFDTFSDVSIPVDRKIFDKFIEDNGLKKFTPMKSLPRPEMKNITKTDTLKGFLDVWLKDGLHVEEYGVRPVNNFKLLEELKYYQSPHPDKVKKYDKEDLQSAFEASRQYIMGISLFNNFEEYLKTL